MTPYKALLIHTGGGIRTPSGFFAKRFQLRLYGGRMECQTPEPRFNPWILKETVNGNIDRYGPVWLEELQNKINELKTDDPQTLLELLDTYQTEEPGQRKKMAIQKPTVEILTARKNPVFNPVDPIIIR